MVPRPSGVTTCLVILVCLLVILTVTTPGTASPPGPSAEETTTPSSAQVSAIYLPVVGSNVTDLPTATPTQTFTPTPTATPTATPTPPPACTLPAQSDTSIVLTITPNRDTALEQLVGRAPFTVNMTAAVTGGTPPYTYCWDLEPDGHQDASIADPTFTLIRAGAYDPLLVVFDSEGRGQYVGTPPAASPLRIGGRP
jgi:hypothetical protein